MKLIMNQLTQKELQDIQSNLELSALQVKKCNIYANQVQDSELQKWMNDGVSTYQTHIQTLTQQLRQFNGKQHH
jgi:arsenate reductase-like glutaredoxin family protein